MSAVAGAAGAAAARRRRAEEHEEETMMTGYNAGDVGDGWEFKILRSASGAFEKPEILKRVLEEEGRAGWVMIEKFDSKRVRLKRPAPANPLSANRDDSALGFDPYRTTVGISEGQLTFIIVGCVFSAVAIMVAIILVATRK